MAGQKGQQLIFAGGEVHGLAVPEHLTAVGVDGQISHDRHGRGGCGGRCGGVHAGTADVGLHPRDQLPHGEGLGDVIVCADLQPQHLVRFLLAGGQDDHGDVVSLFPEGAAHVKADHLRQHHIQQDDVGILRPGFGQTVCAVVGLHGAVAFPLEVEAQNVHDIFFVLHDQDGFGLGICFHGSMPPSSVYRFSRTLARRTAATVLASSISPFMQRCTISSKGTRSTLRNSSGSRCCSLNFSPLAKNRCRISP